VKSFSLSIVNPPLQSQSVTIVTAACNEKSNLKPLLLSIEKAFEDLGFTLPMLLIDDGSTDGSDLLLTELENQYDFLQVIRHPQRLGLTDCLKTSLAHTHTDWLYFTPADLESDPKIDLPLLLEGCEMGVDAVAGRRKNRQDGKNVSSAIANWICRLGFGLKIHDMNWIKLVRKDLLATLALDKVTYAYVLPVMAGLGYHIVEVSTPWHPRRSGKSKFGTKRLITSAQSFWKLWWWFYFSQRSK
jgi:dolichol-phosphate mannosyltransferase